jgi:DNA-binding IclR family transcriptional regulator
MDTTVSGVGVIDKSMAVLSVLADGPCSTGELVEQTGITRATVHRLASALEQHGMVRRSPDGRFALGYRVVALARTIDGLEALSDIARPHLRRLSDQSGESAQLYVRDGDDRICVDVAESAHGLRTIVAVGARLTLALGSAGRVLTDPRSGLATSIGEREPGVASVSAPILDEHRGVIAAISVSGPIDRMTDTPEIRFGPMVVQAAAAVGEQLRGRGLSGLDGDDLHRHLAPG